MATPNTPRFSDPSFSARVGELHEEAALQSDHEDALVMEAGRQRAENNDTLNRLLVTATEIARAANADSDTEGKKVGIFEQQRKGAVRRFAKNRTERDLVEVTEGWIIVPSGSDIVKRPPGKANLTDHQGLGLLLTTDGKLYGYTARKGLKPVRERFTKIPRADIQRDTFIPKEKSEWYHPPIPEETIAPRYRAQTDEGLPTLIGDLNNPEGGLDSPYFTPYVLGQCYDALAGFVASNNL